MEKSRAVATQPSSCEMPIHHEAASSAATLEAILLIGMLCRAGKFPIHPVSISSQCQPINELLLSFFLYFCPPISQTGETVQRSTAAPGWG